MFPFTSFRATCLRTLNFDGFFPGCLDDTMNIFAFMLPKSYFESKEYTTFVPYLQHLFNRLGMWKCVSADVLESGTYETDRYGSRFHTHILGPHILFRIEQQDFAHSAETTETTETTEKPELHNKWLVAEVSYDSLKSAGSSIRYYTHLYEAAFPADYVEVVQRLKGKVLQNIEKYL